MEFDSKLFGENIKKYRKINGLSQENLATRLNKSIGTISRFESGELLPNAEEIHILCDEFGISEADLFERQYITANKENISNPFGVSTLYVYFNAFIPKLKLYKKDKFLLRVQEKTDRCEVQFEILMMAQSIQRDICYQTMQLHLFQCKITNLIDKD